MFLEGIGIAGYRSFGPEMQRIGPFNKINLIIGANNAGKSNVLRFLKYCYPSIAKNQSVKMDQMDSYKSDTKVAFRYEIGMRIDGALYEKYIQQLTNIAKEAKFVAELIRKILTSDIFSQKKDFTWFPDTLLKVSQRIDQENAQAIRDKHILTDDEWQRIWKRITSQTGGGIVRDWIPETLSRLCGSFFSGGGLLTSEVSLVPAIREVSQGAGDSKDELMSGKGLIKKLAELEKPKHDQEYTYRKEQFEKINHFLQTVTGNKTARIEIPSTQDIIQVDMDGRVLPLSSLGTGIHEVIIMASMATILNDQIVCIEEPEIHLHPLLQKQLIRYLAEYTNNQYFIATHSAHILDVPDVSVFRIRLEEGRSVIDLVLTGTEKSRVCDELGYKASDLLQSNCIIWVEGPSDRIYLNHWIHAKDEHLIEGIHYSIMFYGGRLLSHLSADDQEVNDFINLRCLNRHLGIVIDSDKRTPDAGINSTKQRVAEEFSKCSDFVWITEGKEIENYIKNETINDALYKTHGRNIEVKKASQFENCIKYCKSGEKDYVTADKIKLATCVVNSPADFSVLDLDRKVSDLVEYIRNANS